MTNYNRLQYIVKNIVARTGEKPANRKGATLAAFIDAHTLTGTHYVAAAPITTEDLPMTAIVATVPATVPATITVTATVIATESAPVSLPFGLTDTHVQLAADAIVGTAMIIAAAIVFGRQCIAAGRRARALSESFASLYAEVSYRLTHGVALAPSDRAESAAAAEVLTTIALAVVTTTANTGAVILHYTERGAIALAERVTAAAVDIARSATAIASATADEFRFVRIARGAIALPALYAC